MTKSFSADTLELLRVEEEIDIEPRSAMRTTIWVVVVEGSVYVRSVKAEAGKWWQAIRAEPRAKLHVAGQTLAVRAAPVQDAGLNAAVSAEYLRKYAASPWAPPIVRAEVLGTTLRLEPIE